MLKVVHRTCCGLDVHKSSVSACIIKIDGKLIPQYIRREFKTNTGSLRELAQWLQQHGCNDVAMESSGKYWIPVWNILELTCNCVLAHPKYTRAIKGQKTDRRDAKWIADLFCHGLVVGSFMPPPDIRQLRDLCRYNVKLTNVTTGEKNRAQNCLVVSNVRLDDVFSDVFGKSSKAIMQHMLEHPGEKFDVAPFVNRRCKTPIADIQRAVDGVVCQSQSEKLQIALAHISYLNDSKLRLEQEITRLSEPYLKQLALIRTVPGFGSDPLTAIRLLSEIGADMSVFRSDRHFASWAGVCPANNASGGKKKSTRIGRGGQWLKPLLVQIANSVATSDKHPEIKARFQRIKARRGHKKAIIAICRMLLTAIFHIISRNEPYNAELYRSVAAPVSPMRREMTTFELFAYAKRLGITITDEALAVA